MNKQEKLAELESHVNTCVFHSGSHALRPTDIKFDMTKHCFSIDDEVFHIEVAPAGATSKKRKISHDDDDDAASDVSNPVSAPAGADTMTMLQKKNGLNAIIMGMGVRSMWIRGVGFKIELVPFDEYKGIASFAGLITTWFKYSLAMRAEMAETWMSICRMVRMLWCYPDMYVRLIGKGCKFDYANMVIQITAEGRTETMRLEMNPDGKKMHESPEFTFNNEGEEEEQEKKKKKE